LPYCIRDADIDVLPEDRAITAPLARCLWLLFRAQVRPGKGWLGRWPTAGRRGWVAHASRQGYRSSVEDDRDPKWGRAEPRSCDCDLDLPRRWRVRPSWRCTSALWLPQI